MNEIEDRYPGDPEYLPMSSSQDLVCQAYATHGYACTRDLGHTGDHAAHGSDDTQYARWENQLPVDSKP